VLKSNRLRCPRTFFSRRRGAKPDLFSTGKLIKVINLRKAKNISATIPTKFFFTTKY
jgi:hypothetical protein